MILLVQQKNRRIQTPMFLIIFYILKRPVLVLVKTDLSNPRLSAIKIAATFSPLQRKLRKMNQKNYDFTFNYLKTHSF